MSQIETIFCGETLVLDAAGVLFWPRLNVLAVADLHLEKGSAAAAQGQLVPPWDSYATLTRLAALVESYQPQHILAVGDSFHDQQGAARLGAVEQALLAALAPRLIWLSGNHDPGDKIAAWAQGGLVFRHQAEAGAMGEISGHFHPKARVVTRAAAISRPCFMTSADKIILPAFGAYTGGLDISHPAIASHFPQGGRAYLLGQNRLFGFDTGAPRLACAAARHNSG